MKKPNSTERKNIRTFQKKKKLFRTTILPTNQKDKKLETFPETKEKEENITNP